MNQVYLKVMQGNAWTEVSVGPKNKVVFSPVQGSVYNLGTIQVTANDQTKNYSIKTTKSPELTFQFKQQNTNSKWFNRDFIEH